MRSNSKRAPRLGERKGRSGSGVTIVVMEVSSESGDPVTPEPSPTPRGDASREPPAWWRRVLHRRRRRQRQDLVFLGIAAAWIVFDQITKVVVREALSPGEHWELASFFRFSHIMNEGAAFGLFGGANGVLAVSAVVAAVVIAAYYLAPPVDHWATRLGLALILGGAIGNLLDRVYQGGVTDFVNFSHFPAFNVADAGINIGVALILVVLLVTDAKRSATHR